VFYICNSRLIFIMGTVCTNLTDFIIKEVALRFGL